MSSKSKLFEPISFRKLTIKNRIFMAPMCQYSTDDTGIAKSWHLAHYGARATGGLGLSIQEATAVSPEGRISARDLGLWSDEQVEALKPIVAFIKSQGTVPAVQLAHAGRKGNSGVPIVAPSAIRFDDNYQIPSELDKNGINKVIQDFTHAAERALKAGFEVIEIHMAHGYLLHEFLSPITNQRKDEYGESLEKRMRLPLQVATALRKLWPESLPVFVRISATDWVDGGWDLVQSVEFCKELKKIGIDFIDVSTAGLVLDAKIPIAPNYQVPFAKEIRAQTQIPTGAVGLITEAKQAEEILKNGEADAILLARELLRNPHWPLQAAKQLGEAIVWPYQYERAKV